MSHFPVFTFPTNSTLYQLPRYSAFFNSVQYSSVVSDSLWPHESQHARPPCSSPTPGVHSDSCPSSQWCHPAISSSVIPFSSCPQSLPASYPLVKPVVKHIDSFSFFNFGIFKSFFLDQNKQNAVHPFIPPLNPTSNNHQFILCIYEVHR